MRIIKYISVYDNIYTLIYMNNEQIKQPLSLKEILQKINELDKIIMKPYDHMYTRIKCVKFRFEHGNDASNVNDSLLLEFNNNKQNYKIKINIIYEISRAITGIIQFDNIVCNIFVINHNDLLNINKVSLCELSLVICEIFSQHTKYHIPDNILFDHVFNCLI